MTKPNKDGWIRHRGGECPVDADAMVEVRFRDGDISRNQKASSFWWDHNDCNSDIMAWRPRKPDIEALIQEGIDSADAGKLTPISEVRAKCVKAVTDKTPDVEMPAAKYFDGPIQWRDRIREIDAATIALNEERASLVAKLKAEGFALIQSDEPNGEDESAHQDMSDPANWRVGDVVKSVNDEEGDILIGGVYPLWKEPNIDRGYLYLVDSAGDKRNRCIEGYAFHSRPPTNL